MSDRISTKKQLSATVYYQMTGIVMAWPSLLATGKLLPLWSQGLTTVGLSLADIHTFILGCMLTIALGVLYQIVPIAFQGPAVPRHVLFWHLPLHILSVIIMVVGFLGNRLFVVGFGGAMLLMACIAYSAVIARSYLRARNKTLVHRALILPVASLLLVLLVGLYQSFFPANVSQSVLFTHVFLGGLAFWGGLVLVFTYKLLPMFSVSHGYKASLPRTIIPYFVGIMVLIGATWVNNQRTAYMISVAACIAILWSLWFYTVDFVAIVRARKRKRLVLPLLDAFVATLFFLVGEIGILGTVVFHTASWIVPSVYMYLFGGLFGLMLSYMQKMIPFLWFEYRFSKRPERKTAPSIDEMVPKKSAQLGMILYFVGVIVGTVDLALETHVAVSPVLVWASAVGLTVGTMLAWIALVRVLTIGGKRPTDTERS